MLLLKMGYETIFGKMYYCVALKNFCMATLLYINNVIGVQLCHFHVYMYNVQCLELQLKVCSLTRD